MDVDGTAMTVPLELRILGGFGASAPPGRALDIASKKNRALLAYLALAPAGPVPRDRLVGLLWSERNDEHARNSLRQALVALRRDLDGVDPSPLVVADNEVALDPSRVRVDAVEFARLAAGNGVQALREAMALYRGDLLDGLAIRDPAFEEWVVRERERWRDLAIATLERLWPQETGEQQIAVVKHLLGLDPLREGAHRALMRAYAEQGNAALALRQYEACRDLLRRELNVASATETEELRRKILQREAPPAASSSSTQEVLSLPHKPSIAVLPFTNMSGDQGQEYFSDGITEDIITELSRFRQLHVLTHHASFRFREKDVDVMRVGHELGIQYLVEGSVRRLGDRLRVTAQLVDVASGHHLWAERFDRSQEDIFAVQDQLVGTIVATLVGRLEAAGADRAKRKPPASLAAYECVLRGDALPAGNPETEAEVRLLFEKAIQLDSSYGRAYALLATSFYLEWYRDMSGSCSALDRAFALAKSAIACDPNDALSQIVFGYVLLFRRSHELAEYRFLKALELNRIGPSVVACVGTFYNYLGEREKALAYLKEAKVLDRFFDPPWYWTALGSAYFTAGLYDEAIAAFGRSPRIEFLGQTYLAACYGHTDRMELAGECVAHVLRLVPDFSLNQLAAKAAFKNAADRQHLIDGMRKAGLPE